MELMIDLIESISISNFFGNETYFCLGTIYHVLGYLQNLGEFEMYKGYYIQSMFENLIDTFRYCSYIENDSNKFIIKSSKYLHRTYDAMIRYNIKNNILKSLMEKRSLFENIRKYYQQNLTKPLSNNLMKEINNKYKIINNNKINIYELFIMIIKDIEITLLI